MSVFVFMHGRMISKMYISISSDVTDPTSKQFIGENRDRLLENAITFLQSFLPVYPEPKETGHERAGADDKPKTEPLPDVEKHDEGKHKGHDKEDKS